MRERLDAVVFDMDGTLYTFENGSDFSTSALGNMVRCNARTYLASTLALTEQELNKVFERIKAVYGEDTSVGLEKEYGIDRYEYFANAWDINPDKIITTDNLVEPAVKNLGVRAVLLTSAPRIWADKVLEYLHLSEAFESRIYTGESDLRKPNPAIFQKIAGDIRASPRRVASVGDQENSDIVPAQKLGMRTVRIAGPDTISCADIVARSVPEGAVAMSDRGWL